MLLLNLKNNGNHPCPCCLITKSKIYRLGMKSDMATRVRNVRIDDHKTKYDILAARKKLFEKGKLISSAHVQETLKRQSLAPRLVCVSNTHHGF
jgi:hypothetical protein